MSDNQETNDPDSEWQKRSTYGRGGRIYAGAPWHEELIYAVSSALAKVKLGASLTLGMLGGTLGALMTNRKVLIGVGGVGAAGAAIGGGMMLHSLFNTQAYLKALDENYADKCFSYSESRKMTGENGRAQAETALDLVASFGEAGKKLSDGYKAGKTVFCFGIDHKDVLPKAHWPAYNVYFSGPDYPLENAALYLTEQSRTAFWKAHIRDPKDINEYVPDSSLIFSRAARAVPLVEKIRNLYRAIEANTGGKAGQIVQPAWQQFIQENPLLAEDVKIYLHAMNGGLGEDRAMEQAMENIMRNTAIMDPGDLAHMKAYTDHVSNIETSSHEPIYEGILNEYAFVDVDRDGYEDDRIKLNYSNHAVEYERDSSRMDNLLLSRKQVPSTCTTEDEEGNEIYYTCYHDASEWVYYTVFPADETATVRLAPETLSTMAALSENDFLSAKAAHEIAEETVPQLPSRQLYAMPLSPAGDSAMSKILYEVRTNIPHHDTGRAQPGLGLK